MAWSTIAIIIATGVSGIVGAIGGWFMSGSSKSENINTEGAIQTKVIVNEQNNTITYVVIGLAIFELLIMSAGIYLCSKLRKMRRQHQQNRYNQNNTVTYNLRFDQV